MTHHLDNGQETSFIPTSLAAISVAQEKSPPTETKRRANDEEDLNPETNNSSHVDRYPAGWRLGVVIVPLCLGILLVAIDNTIIAVAIPKISTEFRALDDVGWYASGYLLTETALQPTLGNFYKYFNVKLVYLMSMLVFEGEVPTFLFRFRLLKLTSQWARFFAQQRQTRLFSSLAEQFLEWVLLGYTKELYASSASPCPSKKERFTSVSL